MIIKLTQLHDSPQETEILRLQKVSIETAVLMQCCVSWWNYNVIKQKIISLIDLPKMTPSGVRSFFFLFIHSIYSFLVTKMVHCCVISVWKLIMGFLRWSWRRKKSCLHGIGSWWCGWWCTDSTCRWRWPCCWGHGATVVIQGFGVRIMLSDTFERAQNFYLEVQKTIIRHLINLWHYWLEELESRGFLFFLHTLGHNFVQSSSCVVMRIIGCLPFWSRAFWTGSRGNGFEWRRWSQVVLVIIIDVINARLIYGFFQ